MDPTSLLKGAKDLVVTVKKKLDQVDANQDKCQQLVRPWGGGEARGGVRGKNRRAGQGLMLG